MVSQTYTQAQLDTFLAAKATPAQITAAITGLVNGASTALDTLSEIDAQIAADEGSAAALAALVGQKAPLASPAFTGTPTLNGSAFGAGGSSLSLTLPVNTMTANGTALIGARNSVDASGGAKAIALPTPTAVGQHLIIERADTSAVTSNTITITGTIRGAANSTVTLAALGAAFEGALYIAESLTSWAIAASIKPQKVLDVLYGGATKAAIGGKAVLPGIGSNVLFPGKANATVYGVNLGIGPNAIDTMSTWTTAYDITYQHRKIDRVARLGCNSIRIQGLYSAYAANPAQYIARVQETIQYAMSSGLRVLWCFLNSVDDTSRSNLNSGLRTSYQTYFKALTDIFGGNSMMLGWDVGNELRTATADIKTLVTNAVIDIRALDAVTPITSSICGVSTGTPSADIAATELTGVDFQDIHIYNNPYTGDGLHFNWLDDFRTLTSKPILFSEFGSNLDPVNLGGAHLPSQTMQAAFMRSMRRYAAAGNVMGFMPWVIEDDSTQNLFGLYDASGNPREQLADFIRFPSTADATATDAVAYRSSPILIADFNQPDGSTAIPTQPMGGAPIITVGTWGISTRRGKLITPDAGGQNVALWETNTADPDLHVEFEVVSTNHHAGVVVRATDATHWIGVGLHDSNFASGQSGPGLKVEQNNGGTFSTLATFPLPVATVFGAKIQVVGRYDKLFIHFLGKYLGQISNVTFNRDATKHGIYVYKTSNASGDNSSFRRLTAQVPIQLY